MKDAYNGNCAFAMSTGKADVKGGKHTLKRDGISYRFSNPVAKLLFMVLPGRKEKADKYWESTK